MREITIVLPVYNDWDAFALFVQELEQVATKNSFRARLVAVNDGSVHFPEMTDELRGFSHITNVDVMHLSRNLGHQRAIAVGLSAINKEQIDNPIIVMDCDGEINQRIFPVYWMNMNNTLIPSSLPKEPVDPKGSGFFFFIGYSN